MENVTIVQSMISYVTCQFATYVQRYTIAANNANKEISDFIKKNAKNT